MALMIIYVLIVVAYLLLTFSSNAGKKRGRPPVVPSLLPWFGNAFSLRRDPARFFQSCREKYGRVYELLLVGQRTIVLSDKRAIASLHRDSDDAFTIRPIHLRVFKTMGVHKNADHVLDVFNRLIPFLSKTLSPTTMMPIADNIAQNLETEIRAVRMGSKEPVTVSLNLLVNRSLYRAGCLALFGPTFPLDTFDSFQFFDGQIPQILMGIGYMSRKTVRARARIISALEAYLIPFWDGESVEGVSDTITTALQDMRVHVTLYEAACLLLLYIFGFQSNTWNVVFWLTANFVVDDTAHKQLQSELQASGAMQCGAPLLESAVLEVLRWATANATVRVATKDTSLLVDGEHIFLGKGDVVMTDEQSMNHDPASYADADKFMLDRFVKKDFAIEAPRPAAFGGGMHRCPGRYLAPFEMKSFVEILLRQYDVKPVAMADGEVRVPHMDRQTHSGTLRPTEELYVELTPLD